MVVFQNNNVLKFCMTYWLGSLSWIGEFTLKWACRFTHFQPVWLRCMAQEHLNSKATLTKINNQKIWIDWQWGRKHCQASYLIHIFGDSGQINLAEAAHNLLFCHCGLTRPWTNVRFKYRRWLTALSFNWTSTWTPDVSAMVASNFTVILKRHKGCHTVAEWFIILYW